MRIRSARGAAARRAGSLIGLIAAAAIGFSSPAAAAEISADMTMHPGALSRTEFDAIVAEAREISQRTHDTHDLTQWPKSWRTGLDPQRLAALWSMPESAALAEPERNVLIEQAADWDLLRFRRPSDAATLWNRLWPLGQGRHADAAPNSEGLILLPDANWSDEAVAMISVFACFPSTAWNAPSDPVVSATTHGVAWNWWNSSGWDAMRRCLEDTVGRSPVFDRATTSPEDPAAEAERHKRRYAAVVAILKAKFTQELTADGCRRSGPDSCLLLYQALFALDRKNAQLVPLLQAMEPAFDLDRPLALPVVSAEDAPRRKHRKRRAGDAGLAPYDEILAQAQRREIFLTYKLPLLLRRPEAWPRAELERTLRQAMDSTLLLARIRFATQGRGGGVARYFADPWQWIDADTAAGEAATLEALGAEYAGRVGCELLERNIDVHLAPLWRGYTIENIRLGHGSCGAIALLALPQVYRTLVEQPDTATAARDAAAFAPIDDALRGEGELRSQALDALESTCRTLGANPRDPWKLCAGIAARDAEKAEQERQRVAAEQASRPPPDPDACASDVILLAVKALGYQGDADFWNGEHTACRLRPQDRAQAIVALTYVDGEQSSGTAIERGDATTYTLDVLIVRVEDGHVVARANASTIDSDAVVFEGLGIDAADYTLAPGRRAFGVRVQHNAHCYQCNYGETALTLYMQDGDRLDALLATTIEESHGEYGGTDCGNAPTQSTGTLAVATTSSHGLADLVLTTTSQTVADDDFASACPAAANTSDDVATAKFVFDGQTYRPVLVSQ